MRYRINNPQVINETIDGEAIMINLVTGAYYSLDRIGGDVWAVLEQGASPEEVTAALVARYDAPTEVVRASVDALIERLASEDLIVEAPDASPLPSTAVAETRAPFSAPKLDKFTDMQDLILLDPVHEVDSRGWPHAAPAINAAG